MPIEVIMPALGVAQDSGLVLSWFSREGDVVTKGEPLMVVETDKSTVELESPGDGTLMRVTATEGEQVPVGTVIAFIVADGEELPPTAAAVAEPVGEVRTEASDSNSTITPDAADTADRISASPKVRRLAQERGIDLATVTGSGPGGIIVVGDLERQDGAPGNSRSDAVWQAMAANVTRSWQTVPHFYLDREVSAQGLITARAGAGRSTTITDLLIAAVAQTLVAHPMMNANQPEVNVGFAVAAEGGLFVPVIAKADTLDLAEIAEHRSQLVERVRQGQHTHQDLSGATFTISNLGMYGVDSFHAIVSEGQAGILAVGRIHDRVVARGEGFALAPVLSLGLSCDHRLVDGMRAAEFLSALADALESGATATPLDRST